MLKTDTHGQANDCSLHWGAEHRNFHQGVSHAPCNVRAWQTRSPGDAMVPQIQQSLAKPLRTSDTVTQLPSNADLPACPLASSSVKPQTPLDWPPQRQARSRTTQKRFAFLVLSTGDVLVGIIRKSSRLASSRAR